MTLKDEILQKAILNAADQLDIGSFDLMKILNVEDINHIIAGSTESESALIFINICKKLYSLTNGNVKDMRLFLHSNNRLIGAKPFDALHQDNGLVKISDSLTYFQH